MYKYFPLIFLLLLSPIALGSIWAIFALIIDIPKAFCSGSGMGIVQMWGGTLGLGGLMGYISCWRLIADLSPEGELNREKDYGLIAWGIAAGMLSCFSLILCCCCSLQGPFTLERMVESAIGLSLPILAGRLGLGKVVASMRKAKSP